MPEIQLPTKAIQDYIKLQVDKIVTDLPKSGKKLRSKVYADYYVTDYKFVVPAGVTEIYITGGGAGGGGAVGGAAGSAGSAGGTTSFGSLLSLPGGGGGSETSGSAGMAGGPGGASGGFTSYSSPQNNGGTGGGSGYYPSTPIRGNGAYCCGGGGYAGGPGGGGGHFVIDYPLAVTPGAVYHITIGKGGYGGGSTFDVLCKGGNGILIVKWWE